MTSMKISPRKASCDVDKYCISLCSYQNKTDRGLEKPHCLGFGVYAWAWILLILIWIISAEQTGIWIASSTGLSCAGACLLTGTGIVNVSFCVACARGFCPSWSCSAFSFRGSASGVRGTVPGWVLGAFLSYLRRLCSSCRRCPCQPAHSLLASRPPP